MGKITGHKLLVLLCLMSLQSLKHSDAQGTCGINCATTGGNNCNENALCKCSDSATGFSCTCNNGYEGNGVSCADVNECAINTDNCNENAMCANTIGSFMCTCNDADGFLGDGVSCNDVNECAINTDNCNENAMCANTIGSFMCTCNDADGFLGDGVSCNACSSTLIDANGHSSGIIWPMTWLPEFTPELRFSVQPTADAVATIYLSAGLNALGSSMEPPKPYFIIQLGWTNPISTSTDPGTSATAISYVGLCTSADTDCSKGVINQMQSTPIGAGDIVLSSYTDFVITTSTNGISVGRDGKASFITFTSSGYDPINIRYVGIQAHDGNGIGAGALGHVGSNWKFCPDGQSLTSSSTTTNSFTCSSGDTCGRGNAIDGNFLRDGTCFTSMPAGGSFIVIDLGDEMHITGVSIYKDNRNDRSLEGNEIHVGSCFSDTARVGDIRRSNVICGSAITSSEASNPSDPTQLEPPIFKSCLTDTYGRMVFVTKLSNIPFAVCEIVIHGKAIAEADKTKIDFVSESYPATETPIAHVETVTLQRTGNANTFTCSSIGIFHSGGTATIGPGEDFELQEDVLSFTKNEMIKSFQVRINADCNYEGNEMIVLGLMNGQNAVIGPQATTTMTITDDDPIYNFQSALASVAEDVSTGYIEITVQRSGITDANSVINVETDKDCDGAGTDVVDPIDYMPLYPASKVQFGSSATDAKFRVYIDNTDNGYEGGSTPDFADETFCVRLVKDTLLPAGDITMRPPNTIMVTIVNDDTVYELCESSVEVNEGDQYAAAICRRGNTDTASCIDVYTQLVTGANGAASNDYTAIPRKRVNFAAGHMTEEVTISTTEDTDIEQTEQVKLVLALPNSACALTPSDSSPFIGVTSELTVGIVDDDTTYSVTTLTKQIYESVKAVMVSFQRESSEGEGVIMVGVYPSPSATLDVGTIFASEGIDYADAMGGGNHEVRFEIGATTAELTIPITDDPNIELDETFYVRIESADGTISEARRTTAVTIRNDDAYFSIQQPVRTVSEKAGQFQVIVQRGPLMLDNGVIIASYVQNAVTITLNTDTNSDQGAATPVSDFQVVSNKDLTFGIEESVKACPINVINDDVVEGPEQFTVTISNPFVQIKPGADKAEITIEDDDGVISCSIGGEIRVPIDEDSADPVIVTCTRNGIDNAAGSDQSLNRVARFVLTAIPESASQSQDFKAYSRTLEFAAGQATIMETINDLIIDDPIPESDETFRLEISSDNSELDSNSFITVTIRDNDVDGFGFAQSEYTVVESCDKLNVVIQRTGGLGDASTIVRVSAMDGTGKNGATYPADYLTNKETVQLIGNQRQQVVTIDINSDNINEGSETFTLALSIVSGPGTINSGAATTTVTIGEQAVTYSVQDTVINREESSGTLPVYFVRNGDFCGSGEIYVSTMQGTATSSQDYIGFNHRLVSFPNTLSTTSVVLSIKDDNYEELPETFTIVIENTGNIVIGSGTTTVNIQDDDERVFFRETAISADEGSGSATLTIVRLGNSGTPTQVRIRTIIGRGTATSGEDFTSVSDRLIDFGATESSKIFTLTITDDNKEEVDETVFVEITGTSGSIVGEQSEAVVTIVDDDKPSSGGLSSTAIVGIVGGAVGFALLISAIGAVLCMIAMRSGSGAAGRAATIAASRAPPPQAYNANATYPSRYSYGPQRYRYQ